MRWDLPLFIFHGKLLRQKENFNFTNIFIWKQNNKRTLYIGLQELLARVTISKREIILSHWKAHVWFNGGGVKTAMCSFWRNGYTTTFTKRAYMRHLHYLLTVPIS
jgi:hypothetical protein